MKYTLQLSLITVALLSSLNAAENQYALQNISVTASQGTTLDKKDVTDSVTIITKEAIEESRVATLAEALSQLGNVAIAQSGGVGQQASMFVRGMDTGRILVLIDGVRYNDPSAPGAQALISQIMLHNIERIEIIKGAQSGVWGSDASGGVINIITSKAKEGVHANLNVEYGSFDSKRTSLQTSYATKEFDILVGGLLIDNDGFSAAEPTKNSPDYGKRHDELGFEKDKYKNQTLNAKLGYNITDSDRVELSAQSVSEKVDFDSEAGVDSPLPNSIINNNFYALSYTHRGSLHNITVQYNISDFDREYDFGGFDSHLKGSVTEAKIDDKINYTQDGFLRIGASYQLFEQKEIMPNTNKKYSSLAAFATNYNKFELFSNLDTIITESLRYDKHDEFNDALTGKLGLKQFVYKNYYFSANGGTGYKAPTLGELYGQWGANPDLKPEKSLSGDFTFGNDVLWMSLFYNEITDLIDWTGVWPNAGYNQVSGKSKLQGFELGYEDYLFNALGVAANYTYLETKDADGKELARRPKSQLDVRATYYVSETFDIGANAQYIGKRYDVAPFGSPQGAKGAQTGEYVVANFVSNVKVNEHVSLYGKINNITDTYYQMVDGYATAGRSLFLGLNAKY